MTQRRKYNPSRGGHAPGHLRDGLLTTMRQAWENSTEDTWWNYLELTLFSSIQQIRWDSWTPKERAIWMTGQLWNCHDILPGSVCALAGLSQGSSYAQLVRQLRNNIETSSGCFGTDSNRQTVTRGTEQQPVGSRNESGHESQKHFAKEGSL
jgi:hypothetical protein